MVWANEMMGRGVQMDGGMRTWPGPLGNLINERCGSISEDYGLRSSNRLLS